MPSENTFFLRIESVGPRCRGINELRLHLAKNSQHTRPTHGVMSRG